MTGYDWEVAEKLNKAVKDDDVEEVASAVGHLDRKSDLDENDDLILYVAREYASEKGYEGLEKWSEEVHSSKSSISGSLKAGFVATSSLFASNVAYDYLFNQEIDPGTFAGGVSEIVGMFALASGVFAGYHMFNSENPDDYFEEMLEDDFSESKLPELEEAYEVYKN